MKKIIGGIAVVVLLVFVGLVFLDSVIPTSPDQEELEDLMGDFGDSGVEVDSTLSYSGKVVPAITYYYTRSAVQEFNQVYVEEGQTVGQGDILFDYAGSSQNGLQINVLEKNFVNYQESLNDYYTRLDNLKTDLKNANQSDSVYVNYLNVEINNVEQLIAQIKLEWANNEEQIKELKESDTVVLADMDGLIYQVNDPKEVAITTGAYVVLYSTEKKIKLNISEYEYANFQEGESVEVYIEALDKTYSSIISKVELVPNNLETSAFSDTSYYNVEIEIPSEIPYGFSATVKVPTNE
ncbi:MAG: hypothetical protein ACK5LZ_02010 [Anaerorhabdus sp.]